MRINPDFSPENKYMSRRHVEARLPNLLEPGPRPANPTRRCIVLITLFEGSKAKYIELFFRTAMWARHSWLVNSDALDFDVEVKLYIEDVLEEKLRPLCEKNHIDWNRDVVTFHAEPAPGIEWGDLGKQMCAYFDPQLAAYERIVVTDADAMIMRPPKVKNMPFFERLFDLPAEYKNEIGYIKADKLNDNKYFMKVLEKSCAVELTIEEIFHRLSITYIAEKIDEMSNSITTVSGWLWTYPARYFHQNRPEFVEWMALASRLIFNDQILSYFWRTHFGFPCFSIENILSLDIGFRGSLSNLNAENPFFFHRYTAYIGTDIKLEETWRDYMGVY